MGSSARATATPGWCNAASERRRNPWGLQTGEDVNDELMQLEAHSFAVGYLVSPRERLAEHIGAALRIVAGLRGEVALVNGHNQSMKKACRTTRQKNTRNALTTTRGHRWL